MIELAEICKQAQRKKGFTNQELADRAGINLSTLNRLYSRTAKSVSLATIVPIFDVLGLSLDAACGLNPDADLGTAEHDLQIQNDAMQSKLELKKEMMDRMYHGIRVRDHVIGVLLFLLVAVLAWAVYLDMNALNIGFWRG